MMLQTDLHNPQNPKRMTKDDFSNNARGINNGQNVDRAVMDEIFDSIESRPLTLVEDDDARAKLESQQASSATHKMELFYKETAVMVERSQKAMQLAAQDERQHRAIQTMRASAIADQASEGGRDSAAGEDQAGDNSKDNNRLSATLPDINAGMAPPTAQEKILSSRVCHTGVIGSLPARTSLF